MALKEALKRIEEALSAQEKFVEVCGLVPSAKTWLISRAQLRPKKIIWVCATQSQALETLYGLKCFTETESILFPAPNALPFSPVISSSETQAVRIECLYKIATYNRPVIIVTWAGAVLQRLMPSEILLKEIEYIISGEDIDQAKLISWLNRTGYERTRLVQSRGEYATRGSVLDIFPPMFNNPIRLDFFGDMLEEIRTFDPTGQRSKQQIEEAELLPASELIFPNSNTLDIQNRFVEKASDFNWPADKIRKTLDYIETQNVVEGFSALLPVFYQNPSNIFDYIRLNSPTDTAIILDEAEKIDSELEQLWESISSSYELAKEKYRVLCPLDELFIPPSHLKTELKNYTRVSLTSSTLSPDVDSKQIFFATKQPPSPRIASVKSLDDDPLAPVEQRLRSWTDSKQKIIICARNNNALERIKKLIELREISSGIKCHFSPLTSDPSQPGITLIKGNISSGFLLPQEGIVVVTYEDLLGRRPAQPKSTHKERLLDLSFDQLKPGDYIVHRDHGIASYQGLIQLETLGVKGEYLLLEYRGGDKLYLPVDRLSLIERYTGVEDRPPVLSKLGSSAWNLTKKRIKKALIEIAHELVELYAARKVRKGYAFPPSDIMFRQFESSFPYEETPDQARAIEAVLKDMESPEPMDRLVCGDVGFGKTEIALRAAFKAVSGGKQVAVLVPTTLLAEQHERTFKQRFKEFPVNINTLSRLKSRQQQKQAIEDTATGKTDILIGTHRLLQADVRFKDLGLLIVDEEHRFGVKDKERLKRIRQTVDCLALTATPIPRTLQMSLLSLRDLSVIETPPQGRQPIKTYMAEIDKTLIKEVIQKEIDRGGQIYFVHPKIQGLNKLADMVNELVPNVRTAIAHGQMKPSELEAIMIQFLNQEIDCLICTTIVESGLDIASVNTILISRADRFGMADLYQLRGRVGRSNQQAYCYLLIPSYASLSDNARARLKAVVEQKDLGGGFELAMSDLQLRGAGNILGVAQSGQIAKVGYELYLDLLREAIEELRGEEPEEQIDPEINLSVSAYIPDDYINDVELRLQTYRRLAKARDRQEALELALEIKDRFGTMPKEVVNLLEVMSIKRALKRLKVQRIDRTKSKGADRIVLVFTQNAIGNLERLVQLVTKRPDMKLLPDGRLVIPIYSSKDTEEILKHIKRVLDYLLQKLIKNS